MKQGGLWQAVVLGAVAIIAGACTSDGSKQPAPTAATKPLPRIEPPTLADMTPRDYPGAHNVVAYHDGYYSGSAPEGDAGFDTLRAMGVKTIISVDGAVPEVEYAERRGMRYIHLPIGYNGFDEERKLQLVRATRDALKEGPVYIHCHHGKHRSAGAAATVVASLGWLSPEESVERMKVSGTAPNYKGLYACASAATVLSGVEIDSVPADFPSQWQPSGYVQGMVEIDTVFDHLKAIEKAGWVSPPDHPDLVPVAEAGRLADLYRVLNETDYVKSKPSELATLMQESQSIAQKLEDMLVSNPTDTAALSAQFKLVGQSCKDCHAKHRD